MLKDPKSLLVVLLGAIGDVVRAFPLVTQISEQYPDCKITWAVETPSVEIVKCHPKLHRIVEYKRKNGLLAYLKFIRELRRESYDVSIDLQRHFKSGITSLLANAKTRIGFNKKNSREGNYLFQNDWIVPVEHFSDKVEQYMNFCEKLGFDATDTREHLLHSSTDEVDDIEQKLDLESRSQGVENVPAERRALFLIGSTWKTREWEGTYYGKVSEYLYENYKIQSYIVGSPKDKKLAAEIVYSSKVPLVNLIGKTTLREYKALCAVSKLGIGSDSGPLHIASGVGLPIVSFWGPTSPTRSRPFQNYHNALQSPIGCAGCYQRVCPGLGKLCMKSIRPEVVMYKVDEILGR